MVYYGPWVQLDDYDAGGVEVPYPADVGNPAAPGSIASRVDAYDPTYVLGAPEVAAVDLMHFASLASPPCGRQGGYLNTQALHSASISNPANSAELSHGVRSLITIRFAPRRTAKYGSGQPIFGIQPPSEIVPTRPAGAIGYEWEQEAGTPVAASANFVSLTPSGSQDDPAWPKFGNWRVRVGVDRSTVTAPVAYAANTLFSWDRSVDPLGGLVDVSSYMDAEGSFQVNGDASISVEQHYRYDLYTPAASWSASISIAPRDVNTGAGNSVIASYRIRPPLFRWIYETRRPPHQRIVQRGSDGLGMTGGSRIFQARTMQSTNRRGAAIR